MKYIETNKIELKSELNDNVKKEIVAFLNSIDGGIIYIGVDDNGNVLDIDNKKIDIYETMITNWINDNAIYPSIKGLVNTYINDDGVLVIEIKSGDRKPYYLKEKGMTPSGCYKRIGRNKYPMDEDEIKLMGLESYNIYYESRISNNQKLTFSRFFDYLAMKKIQFDETKYATFGFQNDNEKYTNLAQMFSDQNSIIIKLAVYRGLDRTEFKVKKEFEGALTSIINTLLEYCNMINDVRAIKPDEGWERKDIYSYPPKAIREAVLNSIEHANFYFNSNIKIEFFDDRLEVSNPGSFYGGITLEQALNGKQSFRNPKLVYVLNKLGYIENYATGLQTIFKLYKDFYKGPIVDSSNTHFTITLPNMNYEYYKNNQLSFDTDIQKIDQKVDPKVDQKVDQKLNDTQNKILKIIKHNPYVSLKNISNELDLSVQAIKKNIKVLKENKFIEREGSNRRGYWKIVLSK